MLPLFLLKANDATAFIESSTLKTRKRILISPFDEKRIHQGLEHYAQNRDFEFMRLRAYVYILWDGVIRPRTALGLNIEEVVKDPTARRITIVDEARMRPCEFNRNRELTIALSERTQGALREYLQVVRREGWVKTPTLRGPLFMSSRVKRSGARMAERTPRNLWSSFQRDYIDERLSYTLDDIVFTGRMAFLQMAGGDVNLLLEYADVNVSTAYLYAQELDTVLAPTVRDIMSKMQRIKRKP